MQAISDALNLRMKSLNDANVRIRKQILKFVDLDDAQRKEVRQLMHKAMQMAEDVQNGLKK